MELSEQTQITDHSSERIEFEPDGERPEFEDNLIAIIEAKDEQIKRLQLGNLCFSNRAKHLEGKVEHLEAALKEAHDWISTTSRVLSVLPLAILTPQQLQGSLFVVRCLLDEAESSTDHDLAMVNLPDTDNGGTDSED